MRYFPALSRAAWALTPALTFFGSSQTIFTDAAGAGIAHNTGTVANTATGERSTNTLLKTSRLPELWCRFWPTLTNIRWFIGLSSSITPPVGNDPLNSAHGFGFQKRTTSANWFICSNSGDANDTNDDTGIVIASTIVVVHFKFVTPGIVAWKIWNSNVADPMNNTPDLTGTMETDMPDPTTDLYYMMSFSSSGTADVENVRYISEWRVYA